MIVTICVVAIAILWFVVISPGNTSEVKKLTEGKNPEQKQVIEYFRLNGCFTKIMSDEEYKALVRKKVEEADLKNRALEKLNIDESEVQEIDPIVLEGYRIHNAYYKNITDKVWVSSRFQVTWIFFSSTQLYLYTYTFNLDEDLVDEHTEEFFYKDVTSLSTLTEKEDKDDELPFLQFKIVVPGDCIKVAMGYGDDGETKIQAMKQKLREKKM